MSDYYLLKSKELITAGSKKEDLFGQNFFDSLSSNVHLYQSFHQVALHTFVYLK
jgi:hypothetical protein